MSKLRNLRIEMGYTYAQMAQLINVCTAFYWQIENRTRGLSYGMAKKIASVFNLKPDDIFYDEEFK